MSGVWTCYLCRGTFQGERQASRHKHNWWKLPDDPTRCDNAAAGVTVNVAPRVAVTPAPVITRPIGNTELARREPVQWEAERAARAAYTLHRAAILDTSHRCRNMVQLQDDWDKYLSATKHLCSKDY